ncbi:hypothetical protein [Streptomyces sp. KL110A]|uniref:hypothetical protein n=1 Tax=Streptomyces sp. KL110A TaxID=3384221 RepID=UPI0038CB8696
MPTARFLLWGGLVTAAGGAVLCVLGWYGISGERFAERQLPYLASCTVPGAALLVAGAVLVAAAVRTVPTAPDEPGDAAADLAADGTVRPAALLRRTAAARPRRDAGAPPGLPAGRGPGGRAARRRRPGARALPGV